MLNVSHCMFYKVVAVSFNTLCYGAECRGIKTSARIKKIILEFHAIDPVGQTFRYPTNRKHKKSFSQVQNFNIATIKTEINKVAQYFMGIDAYLEHYMMIADSMIIEY